MSGSNGHQVKMIPIDQINVLNPRSRGRAKFQQIVRNIEHLGLKKPICVALHPGQNGTPSYDLVCGQGRIEAETSSILQVTNRKTLPLPGVVVPAPPSYPV